MTTIRTAITCLCLTAATILPTASDVPGQDTRTSTGATEVPDPEKRPVADRTASPEMHSSGMIADTSYNAVPAGTAGHVTGTLQKIDTTPIQHKESSSPDFSAEPETNPEAAGSDRMSSEPDVSDTAARVIPATGTNPMESHPAAEYYPGYAPVYDGIRRGAGPSPAASVSGRIPLPLQDTSVAEKRDTITKSADSTVISPPTVLTDSLRKIPQADSVAAAAAPARINRPARILAAAGTSAAVIGAATFILLRQNTARKKEDNGGIPDPPAPPGYW